MKKKLGRKILAGILLASMATSNVVMAATTDNLLTISSTAIQSTFPITDFADYSQDYGYGNLKDHWAKEQIQITIDKGGITGVPYGSNIYRFEANRKIKTAEFLSMILKLSGISFEQTADWTKGVMDKAIEIGIINENMRYEGNEYLTREKAAFILCNSEEKIRKQFLIVEFDTFKISDIRESDIEYVSYVIEAYALGLVTNKGNGYVPKGTVTRAEACAMVNRLFEYTKRVDNGAIIKLPPESFEYQALPDGSNVGYYFNFPTEGQIGPDGNVITRDPETGILGFGNGQKGGIWLGLTYPNGKVIGEGSTAPIVPVEIMDIYEGTRYMSGPYENHGGYLYWRQEWNRIDGVIRSKLMKEYPNAPIGTVADINGNIISGSMEDNDVHFFVDETGMWMFKSDAYWD